MRLPLLFLGGSDIALTRWRGSFLSSLLVFLILWNMIVLRLLGYLGSELLWRIAELLFFDKAFSWFGWITVGILGIYICLWLFVVSFEVDVVNICLLTLYNAFLIALLRNLLNVRVLLHLVYLFFIWLSILDWRWSTLCLGNLSNVFLQNLVAVNI